MSRRVGGANMRYDCLDISVTAEWQTAATYQLLMLVRLNYDLHALIDSQEMQGLHKVIEQLIIQFL